MIAPKKPLLYARVMRVHGPAVDRRTLNYKSEHGLRMAIRRELIRLPGPGPYVVTTYRDERRVSVVTEL